MKPEEARQKWCPFVRHVLSTEEAPCNRHGLTSSPQDWNSCIADQCMMWRTRYENGEEHGYCGLCR